MNFAVVSLIKQVNLTYINILYCQLLLMWSYHSESEFYYPDEMTNDNEKENTAAMSSEENLQNVDVFMSWFSREKDKKKFIHWPTVGQSILEEIVPSVLSTQDLSNSFLYYEHLGLWIRLYVLDKRLLNVFLLGWCPVAFLSIRIWTHFRQWWNRVSSIHYYVRHVKCKEPSIWDSACKDQEQTC